MLTIKLNENTNSGMLYAIAYCEDPDIYSEDFWGWDTESDVGYELMEFGSLIQDADVFDSLEAAEDRADDVLSSIFEDEVFIVGLDPYTPHNLTGFVKKIIRDSINESKSIKEGTFHWSDNKAAYEAIKVKNALKKAFNTNVFHDSQNLYIPFNFWGRKDAEKAGVTIDTVGKFLNSIGYKYTGRSEDDEDVYNYLKDDVKIELYEVDYSRYSGRYAIHLDFDSEVDDKLDIDTTSFSSYVNTDDVDAVQDLLLDIVEGRVKTLGDIVISEEDIKNIKKLCGRTLDMYTYDFAGYSDDIVDKVDDYFAMKQYQELHNKHVDESKSIKEDVDDNITNSYKWDTEWELSFNRKIFKSSYEELDNLKKTLGCTSMPYIHYAPSNRIKTPNYVVGTIYKDNGSTFWVYIEDYLSEDNFNASDYDDYTELDTHYFKTLEDAKAYVEDWFNTEFEGYTNSVQDYTNKSKSSQSSDLNTEDLYDKLLDLGMKAVFGFKETHIESEIQDRAENAGMNRNDAYKFAREIISHMHDKHFDFEDDDLNESKSIKEDINDSDEVLTFKRDVNLANDADEIQLLIYELLDGVAEDIAQQAFNENESNDLETLKSAVITAIDVYFEDNEWLDESKSIKESTTGDYVEVAYICDGFTNFRVYGGGFKTSDALVAVEDEKGKRLRLTMGDVCEFYTWYDAKGNVIHEPTYYSED